MDAVVLLPRELRSSPVGREKLPDDAREQRRRAQALDAATAVFAKRGYLGTTVDQLVAAAGIGVGSFYDLMESKEGCFLRVYEAIAEDVRKRVEQAVSGSEYPPAQVCAALRALLEMTQSDPNRAKVALLEVQTAGPRALSLHQRNLDAALPLLRRCRALSPFAEELPPTLEQALVGGVAWLAHQRLASGEGQSLPDLYGELVDVVLGPYFGEAEAKRFAAEY